MQKIVPHLWFDHQAGDAAVLYTSLFDDSSVHSSSGMSGTPSGEVQIVNLSLLGQEFMFLSAGPEFRFTPAVSFLVSCRSKAEVDRYWQTLSDSGSVMMPLDRYPFSDRYGWIADRYGLSWQLMYSPESPGQRIVPTLMFVGENCGHTEAGVEFYTSVFHETSVQHLMRYGPGSEPNRPEFVQHAAFTLEGQSFAAMDSALQHDFGFNEAVSFIVRCESQEEIDYYWKLLSARPEAERCGWLKDRYGLSWQVLPSFMDRLMMKPDGSPNGKAVEAMLAMKKLDIAALRAAGT